MSSTRMCGFNQSELIFLIWTEVVSNQISATFYGNDYKSRIQLETKFHFLHCLFQSQKNSFLFHLLYPINLPFKE